MKNTEKVINLISKIRDKANNLILAELRRYNIIGLAPSHGAILNLLFKSKEDIRMIDIAEKIGKDKSTVTALINKLSKLGYVQRIRCQKDQRTTYISLTQKGLELKPIFIEVSNTLLDRTFKNFNDEEKVDLINKLEKMNSNF